MKNFDGISGMPEQSQTPHFGSENTMKGVETLANDIRHYEVEVAQWKKEYKILQNVCNMLVEKLGLYMDMDDVKKTIREMGIGVR